MCFTLTLQLYDNNWLFVLFSVTAAVETDVESSGAGDVESSGAGDEDVVSVSPEIDFNTLMQKYVDTLKERFDSMRQSAENASSVSEVVQDLFDLSGKLSSSSFYINCNYTHNNNDI